MIDEAIRFAANAHKGMVRKGNNQPYIFHPLEVLNLVSLMTLDDEVLCAAVLHDTLEDTNVTADQIRAEFGDRVTEIVLNESEDKRGNKNKEATWMARKQETVDRLKKSTDLGSKMVCLGDKVSNLRSFHMGLLDKGEEFWNIFNQKDPLMHYWYYNELRKALIELQDQAVYKEFSFLIDTIFGPYLNRKDEEQ